MKDARWTRTVKDSATAAHRRLTSPKLNKDAIRKTDNEPRKKEMKQWISVISIESRKCKT